jgi:hypothetical protein
MDEPKSLEIAVIDKSYSLELEEKNGIDDMRKISATTCISMTLINLVNFKR